MGILRKRCDCEKALRSTSALPVCQYFVTVKASPIANETESSWLQAPGQDYAINRDRGSAASMMCMEMSDVRAYSPDPLPKPQVLVADPERQQHHGARNSPPITPGLHLRIADRAVRRVELRDRHLAHLMTAPDRLI